MKYPRMPEHLDRRRKMLIKDIMRATQMRRMGKSYAEIGRTFGISETAAKYWVNPEWRELAKEKARKVRRERWGRLTSKEKKEGNEKTVAVLMRKRAIQPEYKEYSDQTHYKYAKTKKASDTRRKYHSQNKGHLNELQHVQYLKHRTERIASRKEYVQKNIEIIRQKSREYYQKNRERILARHKRIRAEH